MDGKRKKGMLIAAFTVLGLLAVAGIISTVSFLVSSGGESKPTIKVDSPAVKPETEPKKPVPSQPDLMEKPAMQGPSSVDFTVKFDGDGMALMPRTSDPREAAAAAAVIAFSVDATKVDYPEYVDRSTARMAVLAEEGEDPIITGPPLGELFNIQNLAGEWQRVHPGMYLLMQIGTWQSDSSLDWNWWKLSQKTQFEMMSATDTVWAAEAYAVYDVGSIANWGVRPPYRDADRKWVTTVEGASIGDYWVQLRVEESMRGNVYNVLDTYAVVTIWCDPPVAGGLCSVREVLEKPVPVDWAK